MLRPKISPPSLLQIILVIKNKNLIPLNKTTTITRMKKGRETNYYPGKKIVEDKVNFFFKILQLMLVVSPIGIKRMLDPIKFDFTNPIENYRAGLKTNLIVFRIQTNHDQVCCFLYK